MNKKDLTELGIAEDVAERIVVLHGKDIEAHKTQLKTLQTELETANKQLTEAATTIEGFKKLDVDGIKAAADDYKAKLEQAQRDSAEQLATLKFEHELDGALTGKVKNVKAVKALMDTMALKDANGLFIAERLTEQLTKIKAENDYLFTDAKEPPKIVTGGTNKPLPEIDKMVEAARKYAGVSA